MRTFDVQGIGFDVPSTHAFAFTADPGRLPEWTQAFASVNGARALLRTPNGEVEIGLEVNASAEEGTIDWRMAFPDGSVATAFSRVVPIGHDRCVYSFTLTAPPVPLEQLEGALDAQSRTLAEELEKLKAILERQD